jgi:NADH-quinone oxidoreductase subunit K
MLEVSLVHYLTLSAIIFVLSGMGIGIAFKIKSVVHLLISIQFMMLAVVVNLAAFSCFSGDYAGKVFAFFIVTVLGAEAAVGLAILTALFRKKGSTAIDDLKLTEG